MVKEQGTPVAAHYEQANMYAAAKRSENILFIYQNRNDGQFYLMLVPYSAGLYDASISKWKTIFMNKVDGVISDRPHIDPTSFPCSYCEYRERCYEGYDKQIDAGSKGLVVQDPVMVAMAKAFAETRRTRLTTEKMESSLKEDLLKAMIQNQMKSGVVPEVGTFEVKLGSKQNPLLGFKEAK